MRDTSVRDVRRYRLFSPGVMMQSTLAWMPGFARYRDDPVRGTRVVPDPDPDPDLDLDLDLDVSSSVSPLSALTSFSSSLELIALVVSGNT